MKKTNPQSLITAFPQKHDYLRKYYILDASHYTLGHLSVLASKLLRGKNKPSFTPGVDLGNFVIILNAKNIQITGKKNFQKTYYRTSQRPGNLKKESFFELRKRLPCKILEKAIWGMIPKGVLGRIYYSRLFVYEKEKLDLKKNINYEHALKNNEFYFI